MAIGEHPLPTPEPILPRTKGSSTHVRLPLWQSPAMESSTSTGRDQARPVARPTGVCMIDLGPLARATAEFDFGT